MNIVVFEDSACEKLAPVNTCRPSYAITCASYRLYDWLCEFTGNKTGIVRDYLRTVQSLDYPGFNDEPDPDSHWTVFINARSVPSTSNIDRLIQLIGDPADTSADAMIAVSGNFISAARIPTALFVGKPVAEWPAQLNSVMQQGNAVEKVTGLELFEYPHDVIRENMACFESSLSHRINNGNYREIADNVFAAGESALGDYGIVKTESGPVVLEENVSIGPYCFLRGPIYFGPNTKINEHASIKDFVSAGHTCRLGGEVEAVVIEPWSNKQHQGFLGHSYVGSWINLGAGTSNSDLKNTYGKVNLNYDNLRTGQTERVASGMQFVGCAIGDYSKSAINTSIFTGKMIGVCSMLYGFVTTNVPAFVNYARSLGQSTTMSQNVMITTQQRMFERRGVPQRPCDIQLIKDVFELTAPGRGGLSDELPTF